MIGVIGCDCEGPPSAQETTPQTPLCPWTNGGEVFAKHKEAYASLMTWYFA